MIPASHHPAPTPPIDGARIVGEVRYRETVAGVPHFDVDNVHEVALDFLASLGELKRTFAGHAEVVTADNPHGTSDDDWRMAFIEDANNILILVGRLERRIQRLERETR